MAAFEALFGDQLLSGKATVSTKEALNGKTVLVYFSAHWCGPCRMFTPMLIDFYQKHHTAKNFELVFVSSDRDQGAFNEYYGSMPWKALAFDKRELKAKLSAKYKVQGIPTLVAIDKDGKTITTDARGKVMQDQEAKDFPWTPKPFWAVMGDAPLRKHGHEKGVNPQDLKDSVEAIGIYFSASWCGPCRAFTPELIKTYQKLHGKFEIILSPGDRDKSSWHGYWKDMPWLSFDFGDERGQELGEMYGVEGIPTLVIVDAKTGKTITVDGRAAVGDDLEGKDFPWRPKPVNELGGSGLNEHACLCLMWGDNKKDDAVFAAFEATANELIAQWKAAGLEDDQPVYFYKSTGGGLEQRVRSVLGVEGKEPALLLMNLPQGERYLHKGSLDAEAFKSIALKYADGSLQTESLE